MNAAQILSLLLFHGLLYASDDQRIRDAIMRGSGVVDLPSGEFQIASELLLPPGATGLRLRGAKAGTVLRAAPGFHGRAMLIASGLHEFKISGVQIEGSPADGILIEHDASDFEVTGCKIANVAGAGIAVRSSRGRVADNTITAAARAAVQIAGAMEIRVENNTAEGIGFGADLKSGVPAAILTSGDTSRSVYAGNHISEVNGNCFGLEGFHDGEVRGNTCENTAPADAYPNGGYAVFTGPSKLSQKVLINGNTFDGMKFGGAVLAGMGYILTRNRFYHVNTSHCPLTNGPVPCVPSDGVYLAAGGNIVEDNFVRGFRMSEHCIGNAPGLTPDKNRVSRNDCADDSPVNARNAAPVEPLRLAGFYFRPDAVPQPLRLAR